MFSAPPREPSYGIRAARPEDRAADLGEALDLVPGEGEEVAVHDAPPPVADADELEVVRGGALQDDAADDRVQSGAIAAAGQDADLHTVILAVGRGESATLPPPTLAFGIRDRPHGRRGQQSGGRHARAQMPPRASPVGDQSAPRAWRTRCMSADSCTESLDCGSTASPSSARAASPCFESISSAIFVSIVCAAMMRHAVTGSS